MELENPIEISAQISKDIDEYCVKTYGKDFSTRLGASAIHHECKRYLWYTFRWVQKMKMDGRMHRLTERGTLEEARFIEYLRGIGCQVYSHVPKVLHYNPESESYFIGQSYNEGDGLVEDVTGHAAHIQRAKEMYGIDMRPEQYRMSGVMGHLGGSLDAIIILPQHYGIQTPVLGEFKTNGTGATFNKLGSVGMKTAKPDHYAQDSLYGYKYGFDHCLYLNTNKNDDSLHIEIVKLDFELAKNMEAKAEFVIKSQEAPPKISSKPESPKCQYCAMKEICHDGKAAEINCRSCKHAKPVENAEWHCGVHNAIIPKHIIRIACDKYESIV